MLAAWLSRHAHPIISCLERYFHSSLNTPTKKINQYGVAELLHAGFSLGKAANDYLLKVNHLSKLSENSDPFANDF
jgi:hypothetical protein